jgi:hypothetical protein
MDRVSSVGIVTSYGLDGPGSNPGWDEVFRTSPDLPWGPKNPTASAEFEPAILGIRGQHANH